MFQVKSYIVVLFLILFVNQLVGQENLPLFQSDEPLKLTIRLPLKEIINDLKERDDRKAELSYFLPNGTLETHQIKIKVRGVNRALKATCSFPPLRLNFKKKQTALTLFEGQNKIKLVTHCRSNKKFQQNILREYMAYKLYQLITPYSFKVRLCEITYIDVAKDDNTFTQVGFLIEDIDDLAKRFDKKEYEGRVINQESLKRSTLDKLTFFQFMIGNLDWSVPNRHNMKIIFDTKGELPIGIPYDFDYAGIVNAPYAKPPPNLNIYNVRTRLFRGFCRIDNYNSTITYYKQLRPKLKSFIENATFLSENSQQSVAKYIQSFYTILNTPKQVAYRITKSCRMEHKHIYEYEH